MEVKAATEVRGKGGSGGRKDSHGNYVGSGGGDKGSGIEGGRGVGRGKGSGGGDGGGWLHLVGNCNSWGEKRISTERERESAEMERQC